MKKLTVRQHAGIQNGCNLAAVIMALISFLSEPKPHFTLWLAIGFVIVGVIWRIIFIKCPHCGDGLTASRRIPKICPNCGKSLDEHPVEEA